MSNELVKGPTYPIGSWVVGSSSFDIRRWMTFDNLGLIIVWATPFHSPLEIQSKTEFDDAAAGIVGVRKIAVGAGGLAEAGAVRAERGGDTVAGGEQQEVRQVEGVQRLHAEFDVGALSDVGLLEQAEVPLLLHGSVEEMRWPSWPG